MERKTKEPYLPENRTMAPAIWKNELDRILPVFGHRNWILVVDKAFPEQTTEGMEYVDTGRTLPEVLSGVLEALSSQPHIRPAVYFDKELDYMDDTLCPGIEDFKMEVRAALAGAGVTDAQRILHDEVFGRLDKASALFKVLVLKTETLLPYTSVFIELDCGYWPAEKEKSLRERMQADRTERTV